MCSIWFLCQGRGVLLRAELIDVPLRVLFRAGGQRKSGYIPKARFLP